MTQKQKLVYGVGVNDIDEPVKINGKPLKFYNTWKSMLKRCYSEKYQAKNPTYVGCGVCDEWLVLSNFKVWFDANYRTGMELDKDILIPSNKVYSPDTCQFVPHHINSLLTDDGANRGDYPLGVRARKPNPKTGKRVNVTYEASCRDGHGGKLHKTFKTVAEARQWYITTKKKVAKEQAIHAFEAGDITEDVYQALITRQW